MKSLLVVLLWGAAAEGGLQSFTQLATRMPSGREQHFECTSVAACPSESAAQCVKLGPSKCYSFAISPGWRGGKTSQLFAAGSLSATVHAGWTTWALGEAPPVKVEWLTPNIVMNKQGGQWSHVPPVKQGEGFGPVPPVDDKWRRNTSTVTVLIAALRETRCGKTLYSLFDKANHPSRVYIGVVQQNDPSDVDCLDDYCAIAARNGDSACKWRSHVRMKRLLAAQAAGPVYARALQRELVEPSDDFCVQIDAHTEGIDGWDNRFLNEWGATNNEFAVLSTYPTNIDDLHKNSNKHWEMPHLCCASLGGQIGAVRNCQAKAAANLEKPILAPLWAAGMSFARCHAERDVPNDINLRHIFTGEEFGRGVRLWTHGYDFYSVTRPIIGVYYGGAKGGKGGWRSVAAESQASYARLGTLLEWPGSDQSAVARRKLEGYGIGKRRTLKMCVLFFYSFVCTNGSFVCVLLFALLYILSEMCCLHECFDWSARTRAPRVRSSRPLSPPSPARAPPQVSGPQQSRLGDQDDRSALYCTLDRLGPGRARAVRGGASAQASIPLARRAAPDGEGGGPPRAAVAARGARAHDGAPRDQRLRLWRMGPVEPRPRRARRR